MADYRDNAFPEDDATRRRFPMADGLLDYFPNALAAVAEVSKIGNDKHNPGEPMHHARGKSMDHRNKIMRHLCDAGGKDSGGVRHSAYVAWRALALLQEELEREEGAPMARAARVAEIPGLTHIRLVRPYSSKQDALGQDITLGRPYLLTGNQHPEYGLEFHDDRGDLRHRSPGEGYSGEFWELCAAPSDADP